VDYPDVTLERQVGGAWETVLTGSGRPVSRGPDILVTHTPDPLLPFEIAQTHYWYAAWQAVGHVDDRAGLPAGTYRLFVQGRTHSGSTTTYPWDTADYTVEGTPFTVVPAVVTAGVSGSDVTAAIVAPARGYRLVGLDGSYRGYNPLSDDAATLTFVTADGETTTVEAVGVRGGGYTTFAGVVPAGATRVTVVDTYGNTGTVDL
jgi:hypothetical protein